MRTFTRYNNTYQGNQNNQVVVTNNHFNLGLTRREWQVLGNGPKYDSANAEIIVLTEGGELHKTLGERFGSVAGLDTMAAVVRTAERPGEPMKIVAMDLLALQLSEMYTKKCSFSFKGNLSTGRDGKPYAFITELRALPVVNARA